VLERWGGLLRGAAGGDGDDALTMQAVEHNGHEKLTLLELVLQLHSDFRRRLESIRVTPLQAGVLLFLRRHQEANMTKTAAALCIRLPTLTQVVSDLVRKRWVIRRRSVTDTRVVHLRLNRAGLVLTRKIEIHVHRVSGELVTPIRKRSSRTIMPPEG